MLALCRVAARSKPVVWPRGSALSSASSSWSNSSIVLAVSPKTSVKIHPYERYGHRRWQTTAQQVENTNAGHSRFIAEASRNAKWKDADIAGDATPETSEVAAEDLKTIADGKGKLSPTSSHLFKLIIPLAHLKKFSKSTRLEPPLTEGSDVQLPPPTVFLVHPSQPLSHIGRLIAASLAPATPSISFRSTSPRGRTYIWSDSTDIADFVRDAARTTEFEIFIEDEPDGTGEPVRTSLRVEIPSFEDRTRFLRRRLAVIEEELNDMEHLKHQCDTEASKGAQRMAVGGLGMMVVYWGAVARLTFWDYGWDIMEPITYLSGLSTVILGYLWFLYQGREVSYSSVLQRSVSARREALYRTRGLDIDRWADLVAEQKRLRKEVSQIAEDYSERRWTVEDKKANEDNARRHEQEFAEAVTDRPHADPIKPVLAAREKEESEEEGVLEKKEK